MDSGTRRDALRAGAFAATVATAGVLLSRRGKRPDEHETAFTPKTRASIAADPRYPDIAVVQGMQPDAIVRRAVEELGGMRRFVSPGDIVVVKPNAAWDRAPEQAANTNPEVIAAVVRLCLEAGARRVTVTDHCTNEARSVFERSRIAQAARQAGAEVVLPEQRLFREVDLRGEVLRAWPVLLPFLTADKIINVPVAKHHSLTQVTLGMKNLYGILGGQRQRLHQRIDECLADLTAFLRPTLTIVDAFRVLMRNGPAGGSISDVALRRTVIASIDPVAADAYAARAFWNLEEQALSFLSLAARRGLGVARLETLRTSILRQ